MSIGFQHIQEMSLVVLSGKCVPLGSKNVMVRGYIVIFYWVGIQWSVNLKTLMDLSFHYFDRWLFDCKICHFDVKTMEMNSFKGISNVASKFWFTNFIKSSLIRNSTCLMEFSEQIIEVNNRSSVDHKFMPIWALWHNFIITLEFGNNLLEIPWESENIPVLLFTECDISSNINVVLLDTSLFLRGILGWCDFRGEISHSLGSHQRVSCLSL